MERKASEFSSLYMLPKACAVGERVGQDTWMSGRAGRIDKRGRCEQNEWK